MPTTPERVDGVDLSHHNPVTLDGLPQGQGRRRPVVYHKATEGDSYTDPTYDDRRKLAARAGRTLLTVNRHELAHATTPHAEEEACHDLGIRAAAAYLDLDEPVPTNVTLGQE